MDLTPLLHAAITLAAQAVVGLLTGDWLAGGVLACLAASMPRLSTVGLNATPKVSAA